MTVTTSTGKQRAKTRRPLSQIAYEELKKRIIRLEYGPGSYLNESGISDDLEIGRTPVHHAVQRLTHEGMLEVIPRKGLIVKPLDMKEVMEIVEVRLLNEALCARKAAENISDSQVQKLENILAEADRLLKNGRVDEHMTLDQAFHETLSTTAGNQVLADILKNLHERSLRVWFVSLNNPQHADTVSSEHADIVKALANHDPDAAEEAMRAHILAFKQNILNSYQF